MEALIAVAGVLALLVWLVSGKRRPSVPVPEDDVATAVDHKELEGAERDLADDASARPIHDGMVEDEDDWGPGTSR